MGRRMDGGWPSAALAALLAAGCTPGLPRPGGMPATAAAPNQRWTPPSAAVTSPAPSAPPLDAVPSNLQQRIRQLTLSDVVDLALRNSPTTRESWATARAAAATYGSANGAYYPTIDLTGNVTRLKTVASQGRSAVEQTVYGPSVSLSYLLFDFGGRGGVAEGARQALYAADWTHNAQIANVVLQTQQAYYLYIAQRTLLTAQQTTVDEANANLAATEERRRAGLATIADVLQARTAASQALLAYETTEGARETARGALALSLGLPATLPYDVDSTAAEVSVSVLADSVQPLIERAIAERPELASARASFLQSRAAVRQAHALRLPSLALSANGGRTYLPSLPNGGNSYTVTLGLTVPIFSGFAREYDQAAAEARADAAGARVESLQQTVIFQVFSAYSSLQTATRRVRTADDLLASATQSVDAARARYKEGIGSILDLLAAQVALADARAQRIDARLTWNTSLAQLAHDAGLLDERGRTSLRLTPDSTMAPSR